MEFQKIVNLLNTTSDDKDLPIFVTKKWIEVHDQSGRDYRINKAMRIETPMLRSDLCDFSDAYTVVKGYIAVTNPDDVKRNKSVTFKNNAPFINCISKINGLQIDNVEDLDVVIPMYNFLEYSKNYKKTTTGSLWNYYRDESNDFLSSDSESFKYKTSITGNTYDGDDNVDKNGKKETEIVVPLKHSSSFWRTLNMPLINCEMELILNLPKDCVLADMTIRAAGNNDDPPAFLALTGVEFQIMETKLYIPVVTLSTVNDKKLLEQLKSEFKRTFERTFTRVNRLFVLSFERIDGNGVKRDYRDSFSRYYVPNVEIKDFNVLIDTKRFFNLPVKNVEEAYKKIIKMSKNNDYTAGNLLNFAYFKENYKLIATDLSKQTNLKDLNKLILSENSRHKTMEQQCFLSLKNQKKLLLSFCKIL